MDGPTGGERRRQGLEKAAGEGEEKVRGEVSDHEQMVRCELTVGCPSEL